MLSSSVGGLAARHAVSCLCVSSLAQLSLFHRAAHSATVASPGKRSRPSTVLPGVPGFEPKDASHGSHDDFKGMLQLQLEQTSARLASAGQALRHSQSSGQPTCSPSVGYMPDQSSSAQVRMESQLIFDSCWRRFKERHGASFAAPREVIWLNGAPGSGKGISTPHIQKARGLTRAVCMSSLLSSAPEARKFIETGEMIADHIVGDLLLEALLLPVSDDVIVNDLNSAVVDGFPRTAVQVDFLKLLMEKLRYLHTKYMDTPYAARFPRPTFKVVMLYVDEETSISRQMQRAELAMAHNRRVMDAGVGEQQLQEERSTDVEPEKARKRYHIFKQHYPAVLRLKQFFPFHLIDASYSFSDTQEQITQELRYQSSLDLSEETYSAIRHLPLAKDLQQTARQQLVSRLEGYCRQQRPLFGKVLGLVQQHLVPLLQQGALSGAAEWVSQEDLFTMHPVCIHMLLDVLSDRGFHAHYVQEVLAVPVNFNTATGAITTHTKPLHRFRLSFDAAGVRDASALKALEIAARITEAARSNLAAAQAGNGGSRSLPAAAPITESFIPEHLDLEAKMRAQDRSQHLRRVALSSVNSASPLSSSCSSCAGGYSCSIHGANSSNSSGAGDVFTIHRCLKPDADCGHADELQVVSAGV